VRLLTLVTLVLLLSACTARGPADDGPTASSPPSSEEVSMPLYLKARYGLSTTPPAKDTPDSVTATPFQNAFVNEDIRAFATNETHTHLNITSARLTIFYNVDTPLIAPIVDETNQQANRFVFWLGSRSVYVTSVNVIAEPVLMPGQTYKAEVEFELPQPGWIVPRNEPIMLLFANLVPGANPPAPANAASSNLHFLVDGNATPSRVELLGQTISLDVPASLSEETRSFEILGNTGLFTGAAPQEVPQKAVVPVTVSPDLTYLEVRVIFDSTQAGKSDLDFTFFAPDGRIAAASTTPYQSETVRLFGPNLSEFGVGSYRAEITAYSGADTRFDLRVLTNEPR
jgi:hypothetical protein